MKKINFIKLLKLYEIYLYGGNILKKLAFATIFLTILFLGACSGTVDESKNTSDSKSKNTSDSESKSTLLEEPVVINGIEFTVKEQKKVNSIITDDKKEYELYRFEIFGKNLSYQKSSGFGSNEFVVVTTDGKEQVPDSRMTYFGEEIEGNKELIGDLYFSLEDDQKIEKLQYKIDGKLIHSWDIK